MHILKLILMQVCAIYLKFIDASTGQLLWLTLLSSTSTTHLMGLFQMSIGEEFQPDWSGALYTPGFVVSLLLYPILSLLYSLPSFSSFYSQYSFGHSGLLDISSETIWLPSYRANSVIVFCISIYASLLLSVYCSIHFSRNLSVTWVVLPCHEENWILLTYEYYKWTLKQYTSRANHHERREEADRENWLPDSPKVHLELRSWESPS